MQITEHLSDLNGVDVLRDDILVSGSGNTIEEANADHDANPIRLLQRARKVNLKFNSKKLNLQKSEVRYMGHVLTSEGLKPDPDKIQAVSKIPKPTCKQETLSLLGFVNHLAKFLPRLSEIAHPIRELTTKNRSFVWSKQHDEAFEEIKTLVTRHPVLKYYDMTEKVTIHCDASEKGLGSTLLQNGQPVAFASRTLLQVGQRYAQIEKECLAIVFACAKFSSTLQEEQLLPLRLTTNHCSPSSKSLCQPPQADYRECCYYKPGPQMYVADHLSRAYLRQTEHPPKDEFQVFALELEEVNPLDTLKITSERLLSWSFVLHFARDIF